MKDVLNITLTVFVVASVGMLPLIAVSRWVGVLAGMVQTQAERLVRAGESSQSGT